MFFVKYYIKSRILDDNSVKYSVNIFFSRKKFPALMSRQSRKLLYNIKILQHKDENNLVSLNTLAWDNRELTFRFERKLI